MCRAAWSTTSFTAAAVVVNAIAIAFAHPMYSYFLLLKRFDLWEMYWAGIFNLVVDREPAVCRERDSIDARQPSQHTNQSSQL